jgi:hypothetical protein
VPPRLGALGLTDLEAELVLDGDDIGVHEGLRFEEQAPS